MFCMLNVFMLKTGLKNKKQLCRATIHWHRSKWRCALCPHLFIYRQLNVALISWDHCLLHKSKCTCCAQAPHIDSQGLKVQWPGWETPWKCPPKFHGWLGKCFFFLYYTHTIRQWHIFKGPGSEQKHQWLLSVSRKILSSLRAHTLCWRRCVAYCLMK